MEDFVQLDVMTRTVGALFICDFVHFLSVPVGKLKIITIFVRANIVHIALDIFGGVQLSFNQSLSLFESVLILYISC
jgi:hypothetical protein